MAELEQREAMETDEREGIIREYLEMLLPDNWDSMNVYERRNYINGDEFETGKQEGSVRRERVCIAEIWCECFSKDKGNLKKQDSNEIAAIMAKMCEWKKADVSLRFKLYGVAKGYIRV